MSATTTSTEDIIASCSFCAKTTIEVKKLVAGPGVFICDECVQEQNFLNALINWRTWI